MGFIYKITNLKTGKMYIGQTRITVEQRWKEHISSSKNPKRDYAIYRAMRKYGVENFEIETIEKCNDNLLNDREKYWINKFGTFFSGYNSTLGGDSLLEPKVSKEEIEDWWNRFESGESLTHISKTTNFAYTTVQKYLSQKEGYNKISKMNKIHATQRVDFSKVKYKTSERHIPKNKKDFLAKVRVNNLDFAIFTLFFSFDKITIDDFLSLTVKDYEYIKLNKKERELVEDLKKELFLEDNDKVFNISRSSFTNRYEKYI